MKLTFSVAGTQLRCVEDRTPLGRRHLLPYDPPRVAQLSAELLSVLERANRARTLSDANLANLKLAGEELARQLIPKDLQSRLRDSMGSLALTIDEELAPVPWELLYDGEQFLCRRFDLGRRLITDWRPNATVWRPAELQQPLRMLVICSDTRGDLERLEPECTGLLSTMDAHPDKLSVRLLRAQDLETVRRSLKSYDLVHFAGHADYDPTDPGGAGWHLGDGKLKADEIATLGMARPMPVLVFSNACQTGLSGPWDDQRRGRVLGLAGAFLLSGSRFYVGTQWELVDSIGAQVATHFYDALVRGANVGAALRAARLRVVEDSGEEALGWAGYVLYGDPTQVLLPATGSAQPADAGPSATGRLGVRATLPWKRRITADQVAERTAAAGNDQIEPRAPLPPWLVAGIMVLMLLVAAVLGAWLVSMVR
jgi:CHAT domain-containing protein